MAKIGPIKPSDIEQKKTELLPDEVFEAFNELIAENWRGSYATFALDEVKTRVRKKMGKRGGSEKGWYDVEPIYRKAGWKVDFDAPGYNESYPSTFTFSKK